MSDFITVSSFSFSELEDQLSEARDKVRVVSQASSRPQPNPAPLLSSPALSRQLLHPFLPDGPSFEE